MPDRQEFVDYILDHYQNPRHHGALAEADVIMKGGNPGCGDVVTMYVKVDADTRITEVAFEGEGCTISQAAASILTEKVLGKTLAEITEMSAEVLIEDMGREVVASRLRCATLALNTLKAAEKKYRAGHGPLESPVENF